MHPKDINRQSGTVKVQNNNGNFIHTLECDHIELEPGWVTVNKDGSRMAYPTDRVIEVIYE